MLRAAYCYVTLTFLLSCSSTCFAEIKDSLIYRTPFEKKILEQIERNQPTDEVAMLVAFDGDSLDLVRVTNELNQFYATLTPKLKRKDERKTVKIIFDEVHARFLSQYVDSASFLTAFFRHSYSCVSGSAMYGVVLSHYKIPFEAREMPGHVYVVAYPQTLSIRLEATNPKGFIDPNPEFKQRQIDILLKENMMSKDYVSRVGAVKAYNTFFFAQNAITLKNLAGIQYLNAAYSDNEKGRNLSSLQMLNRANILFPTPKDSYYRKIILAKVLDAGSLEKIETLKYLVIFANEYPSDGMNTRAASAFEEVMRESLIKKSNEKFVNQVYGIMSTQLNDSATVKMIRIIYNGHYSNYYLNQSKYEKSLQFASLAYHENPENTVTQALVTDCVRRRAWAAIGSSSTLTKLDETCAEFPFLKNSDEVRNFYISIYTRRCASNFMGDREKEGNEFLALIEKELTIAGPDYARPESDIGNAYAEAGSYYYRERLYDKALAVMYKGLKLAPDHPELKTRIEIVKGEKEYRKK